MGRITFTYQLENFRMTAAEIVGEIEYGNSFSLYTDHETVISPKFIQANFVRKSVLNDHMLTLEVDDSFFTNETIFEKIWTTFILNLTDFGSLKLIDVDFSNSLFINKFTSSLQNFQKTPILGTILKPYYQPLYKKEEMISSCIDSGLQVIKEDETYLVGKQQIIDHSIKLQKATCNHGYYIPNITSFLTNHEFVKRLIENSGIHIVMVNFLISGLGNIYQLKKKFPTLSIWGHRVGFNALDKLLSIQAISQLALASGIDYLHIGTPTDPESYQNKQQLIKTLTHMKPFKAVFTKTNDLTIHTLVKNFGNDAIFLACGYLKKVDGITLDMNKVQNWVKNAQNEPK